MQIHRAAARGDTPEVRRLLDSGVSINAYDWPGGMTPLMYAAADHRASVSVLGQLIDWGADVEAKSRKRSATALGYAAEAHSAEKIQLLLDHGGHVNQRDSFGFTPLLCASIGRSSVEDDVLSLLVKAGANVNLTTKDRKPPIKFLAMNGCFSGVRILLGAGANSATLRWSSLMYAIVLEDDERVAHELSAMPNLRERDFLRRTPWLLALHAGRLSSAKLLLKAGATTDDRGLGGTPPLSYAVEQHCPKLVGWLIKQGLAPCVTDDFGEGPVEVAARSGNAQAVRKLLQDFPVSCAPEDQVVKALGEARNIDVVRVLLDAGANINHIDCEGFTLLMRASQSGREEFVKQLLVVGADPNQACLGNTAMHLAVRLDQLVITKLLIEAGGNVNRTEDIDGITPLFEVQSIAGVKLLLDAGAKANVIDHHGRYPWEWQEDEEIARVLRTAAGQ